MDPVTRIILTKYQSRALLETVLAIEFEKANYNSKTDSEPLAPILTKPFKDIVLYVTRVDLDESVQAGVLTSEESIEALEAAANKLDRFSRRMKETSAGREDWIVEEGNLFDAKSSSPGIEIDYLRNSIILAPVFRSAGIVVTESD